MAASVLQNLAIVTDGKNLTAEWSVNAFKLDSLVQVLLQAEPPATGPRANLLPPAPVPVDKKP
jgi:hypothetical protein